MKKQKNSNGRLTGFVGILIILALIIANQFFGGNLYNVAFGLDNLETTNIYTSSNIVFEDVGIDKEKLNVIFLYVGQADCTFIQKGDYTMLIDAGNSEDGENILAFLKHIGITKLDYLIGTHSDEDHIGGVGFLLKNIEVSKLYMSSIGNGKWYYDSAINNAKEKSIQIVYPELNAKISFGPDIDLVVKSAEKYEGISSNNSSIVLQLTYKNNKFLFMGDCEKESESIHRWEKVDVLKVGHHGSNTSSSEEFLNQVRPHFAVIQVGKNNSYRLPNKYTISRLEKVGAEVLRTDTNECSFWFTSDGTNIVETEVNINLDNYQE